MIKAVIFDVGGVLIRTPDRSRRLAWERKLGLDEWHLEEIVFNGEMGTRAQLGQVTDDELWSWVGHRLELSSADLAQLRRDFWSGDVLDVGLVDYIRRLHTRYQTAIISNATDALRTSLHSTYPIADAFDLVVVSAEEGFMKPASEIYDRALQRLGLVPDTTVFVDDSFENVAGARELGITSIRFHPTLNLPAELGKVGVTVP